MLNGWGESGWGDSWGDEGNSFSVHIIPLLDAKSAVTPELSVGDVELAALSLELSVHQL